MAEPPAGLTFFYGRHHTSLIHLIFCVCMMKRNTKNNGKESWQVLSQNSLEIHQLLPRSEIREFWAHLLSAWYSEETVVCKFLGTFLLFKMPTKTFFSSPFWPPKAYLWPFKRIPFARWKDTFGIVKGYLWQNRRWKTVILPRTCSIFISSLKVAKC